jgi:galactose mutarotase-like enzyme
MENHKLRVVILSGKGTDIIEFKYKPLDLDVLFRNPYGPRNPGDILPTSGHSEVFRDLTGGGWSDILPNAGQPSEYLGAKFGLHEETALLRWKGEITERFDLRVSAKFRVDLIKYPLTVEKKITLGQDTKLLIEETVTNNSNQELPFSWLIHPTFSREFACAGAKIEVTGRKIHRPSGRGEEWVFPYFTELEGRRRDLRVVPGDDSVVNDTVVVSGLSNGKFSILNQKLNLKFTLEWPVKLFPYLWYYRNLKSNGYPYYGRSSFIALEPCTSLRSGLSTQVKNGDVLTLKANSSVSASYSAMVDSLK